MKLAKLIHNLQELQTFVGGDVEVLVPSAPSTFPPMPVSLLHMYEWNVNDTKYILLHGLKEES